MNKAERESFFKSFVLFFSLLMLLISLMFYMEYQKDMNTLKQDVFNEMKICSLVLECPKYEIDFENKKQQNIYTLYEHNETLYSYFNIPDTSIYHLKIIFSSKKYNQQINLIRKDRIKQFLIISLIVLTLTIIFSLYSMNPIRKAFKLNTDFIKDILHDFNTPISSIMINIKTLEKTKTNYNKIQRTEQALNTILSLQDNLKNYLFKSSQEKIKLDINQLVKQRINEIQPIYPEINFTTKGESLEVFINQTSIIRIIDNLISNASKYNKNNGSVIIETKENKLIITDTGIGIKNPNKVFDRFYKEHSRGLGIGLHIVKKLCTELKIKISVKSEIGVGSCFVVMF